MIQKETPRLRVAARGEKKKTYQEHNTVTACVHCGHSFAVGDGRRWRMRLPSWPHAAYLLICRRCCLLLLNSERLRRRFAADMANTPGHPSRGGWYWEGGR